jgi:hypothetical protein
MEQLYLNSNPEGSLMVVSANREDALQLEVWNEVCNKLVVGREGMSSNKY